jgi:hypothetical protein
LQSDSKSDYNIGSPVGAFHITPLSTASLKANGLTYILFKNIFHDPKATKQFSSAGTKTEAMVKYVPELILLKMQYIHLKKTTYPLRSAYTWKKLRVSEKKID